MLVSSQIAVKGGHGFEIAVRMDNLRGGDWGEIQNKAHCVRSMHSRSSSFSSVKEALVYSFRASGKNRRHLGCGNVMRSRGCAVQNKEITLTLD